LISGGKILATTEKERRRASSGGGDREEGEKGEALSPGKGKKKRGRAYSQGTNYKEEGGLRTCP